MSESVSSKIKRYAEYYLRKVDGTIEEIYDDDSTSVADSAFYECRSLTTVDFPLATSIGSNSFRFCSSLTTVSFPLATSIRNLAFYNCMSLTTVDFPRATSIGIQAFYECKSLTALNLPMASRINTRAFEGCSNLAVLRIDGVSKVPSLAGTNAFTGTPTTMKIVVPDALVDSWKTATNWSTYADRIIGVSEYEAQNGEGGK